MCFSKNNKFIFFLFNKNSFINIFIFNFNFLTSFITCNMNLLYKSSLVEKIKVKKLKMVKK